MSKLKILIFGVISISALSIYVSWGPEKENEEDFKKIILQELSYKGWNGETRRNMDIIVDIKGQEVKKYVPDYHGDRNIYMVEYEITFKPKNKCNFYKFIPEILNADTHLMLRLECKEKYQLNQDYHNELDGHLWEATKKFKESRDIEMNPDDEFKTGALKLYVTINKGKDRFYKLAPRLAWSKYGEHMENWSKSDYKKNISPIFSMSKSLVMFNLDEEVRIKNDCKKKLLSWKGSVG